MFSQFFRIMGGHARLETIQHFYVMIQEGHGREGRIRSLAHASYLKVTSGNDRLLEDTERVLSVFSAPANRRAITIELRQAEENRIWLRKDHLPPDRYDTDDCFPFIESCLRTALEGTPYKNEVRAHGTVTLSGGSHGFSGDTFNLLPEFDHQIVVIDLSQFPRHPPDFGLTDRRWGGAYTEIIISNEWVERLSAAAWEPFTQRDDDEDFGKFFLLPFMFVCMTKLTFGKTTTRQTFLGPIGQDRTMAASSSPTACSGW